MGVKGLNTWITANFANVMQQLDGRSQTQSYDHVLVDLNGVVHAACRRRKKEQDVIRAVFQELDLVVRLFSPRATLLLALDGPGPSAKLVEQRKRRVQKALKAARDAAAGKPAGGGGGKKKRRGGFDSLQVTPGTGFMLRLRRALEYYAASRLCGVAVSWSGKRPNVHVSAADVAGEGEVKLLAHLHAVPAGSALLVGPDADLLLLALAAGVRDCDVLTTSSDGSSKLFRVGEFCRHLARVAPPVAAALPCSAGAREGHAAQLDFLVVSFLAGNDYLPKVRGANLPKLWARCAKLLSGEFRGQHLLRTAPGRVALNGRFFVRLVTLACVGIRGGGGAGGGDDDDDDDDDDDGGHVRFR